MISALALCQSFLSMGVWIGPACIPAKRSGLLLSGAALSVSDRSNINALFTCYLDPDRQFLISNCSLGCSLLRYMILSLFFSILALAPDQSMIRPVAEIALLTKGIAGIWHTRHRDLLGSRVIELCLQQLPRQGCVSSPTARIVITSTLQ